MCTYFLHCIFTYDKLNCVRTVAGRCFPTEIVKDFSYINSQNNSMAEEELLKGIELVTGLNRNIVFIIDP